MTQRIAAHRSLAPVTAPLSRQLRRLLGGGDLRSIGRVPLIVRRGLREPRMVSALVAALADEDRLVRMRAADALEKISLNNPQLVRPFTKQLLDVAVSSTQQEVRWHLAQMMPRLDLTPRQQALCLRALTAYLGDRSSIVRTFALQALADLFGHGGPMRTQVHTLLEDAARTGSPAMRSRARRLLSSFRRPGRHTK